MKGRSQHGLLGSMGAYAVGGFIRVKNNKLLAREVNVQVNDIRDPVVNGELKYPPDSFRSTKKS